MTRAYYLSGALKHSAIFTSHGKIIWYTRYVISNAMLTESLAPISHWKTWRQGQYNLVIDCDQKPILMPPVPNPSWRDRLQYVLESALYFFFSRSWPDDRSDDLVQVLQIKMRWIWSVLTLLIFVFALKKKQMKEILIILCLGTALLYIISDGSTVEGRYRKPWEGIAIAAFIYLLSSPKKENLLKQR